MCIDAFIPEAATPYEQGTLRGASQSVFTVNIPILHLLHYLHELLTSVHYALHYGLIDILASNTMKVH